MGERSGADRRRIRRRSPIAAAILLLPVAVLAGGPETIASARAPHGVERSESAERAIRDETLALAPESPPSPDDVFLAPAAARIVVLEREADLTTAVAARDRARRRMRRAEDELATSTLSESWSRRTRNHLARRLEDELGTLTDLAVTAYVEGGDGQLRSVEAILEGDTTDPAGGDRLLFGEVLAHGERTVERIRGRLEEAEIGLSLSTAIRTRRTEALRTASEAHDEKAAEAETARVEHDDAVTAFEAARHRLRTAPRGRPVPLDVAIIGPARLEADDLSSWFESRPFRPAIETPIADIARWFIEEGDAEGIRGDIAFAQAVIETGGFTNLDSIHRNNYSGIGHCDSCPAGWHFPSAREGVRAQIQLLKSYAVASPRYARPLVDRRLRGPAGCCRTWEELTGVWATADHYGPAVMSLYGSIVDHALGRRAAGIGFDDPPTTPPSDGAPS